jgi:hypothetical protein
MADPPGLGLSLMRDSLSHSDPPRPDQTRRIEGGGHVSATSRAGVPVVRISSRSGHRPLRADLDLIERVDKTLDVLHGKWKVHLLFFMARGTARGYLLGAALMILAGVIAVFLAVPAERKALEDVASPYTAVRGRGPACIAAPA